MNVRETTIGSLLVALSAFTFYITKDFPPFRARGVTLPGPSFFPRFVAAILLCCGLLELIQAYREGSSTKKQENLPGFQEILRGFVNSPGMSTIVVGITGIVIYALLLEKVGFQIMTATFLVAMMLCFRVRLLKAITYSVIVVIVMVALFERLFQVPLPPGFFHL